jgi:hypothetical protein
MVLTVPPVVILLMRWLSLSHARTKVPSGENARALTFLNLATAPFPSDEPTALVVEPATKRAAPEANRCLQMAFFPITKAKPPSGDIATEVISWGKVVAIVLSAVVAASTLRTWRL